MEEQKINTRKFIVNKRDESYPKRYDICDFYKGETASGGPVLACFFDEDAANEYASFKNNLIDIKDGWDDIFREYENIRLNDRSNGETSISKLEYLKALYNPPTKK